MYRLHGIGPEEFNNTPEDYTRFVHVDDRAKVEQVIADLLNGHAEPIEYRTVRGDGEERIMAGTNAVVTDDDGNPVSVIGTLQDITDMKNAEAALRASEQRFRALADATEEGVLIHAQGVILEANNAAARLMGLDPDTMVGMNGLQYLSEETRDRVQAHVARGEPFVGTGTMNRPDGTNFEMEFAANPVEYKGKQARVLNFRDVTARNEAERSLRESRQRLRNFAAKLEEARESERTSVSREIHDELGQTLTGLKMDFAWLAKHITVDEASQSRIDSMEHLIDGMVQTVRDLSSRLRPGVLDDLGLVAAIDWQVREFRERSDITCEVRLPSDTFDVDDATATAVFRILQEALTNVARHSSASRVDIDLSATEDSLFLTIRDNGSGVPEEALWSADSIGLIGMRERAGGLGGRVEIEMNDVGGTSIALTLPR
jgi:PAS domain S-box-containing protein